MTGVNQSGQEVRQKDCQRDSEFSRYGRKMASKVKKNGERKLFDLILKEPRLACDVRNTTRDFISFNKLVNCFN